MGLPATSIPLSARILGLADVYDALVTDRSYRAGLQHAEAMKIMAQDAGSHFDPSLFREFEAVIRDPRARLVF